MLYIPDDRADSAPLQFDHYDVLSAHFGQTPGAGASINAAAP
jgi:hypothetical protein